MLEQNNFPHWSQTKNNFTSVLQQQGHIKDKYAHSQYCFACTYFIFSLIHWLDFVGAQEHREKWSHCNGNIWIFSVQFKCHRIVLTAAAGQNCSAAQVVSQHPCSSIWSVQTHPYSFSIAVSSWQVKSGYVEYNPIHIVKYTLGHLSDTFTLSTPQGQQLGQWPWASDSS